MPIDLEGDHTKSAIEHPSKPATTIGVHTTDTNGGTVKADVKWRLSLSQTQLVK